jgi:hypothetical protein
MTLGKIVTVVVNNQQTELLDRLVADGLGATHAEVIAVGFRRFCEEHPELVAQRAGRGEEAS